MFEEVRQWMKNHDTRLDRIEKTFTSELDDVKDRLERIENPSFDPEKTLVFTGAKPSADVNDCEPDRSYRCTLYNSQYKKVTFPQQKNTRYRKM